MSTAGNLGGGHGGGAAAHQYFCYQCDRHVTITPPSSPTDELACPICHGSFLEESDTAPPSNPTLESDPFFNAAFPGFGGLPLIFSSSSAAPTSFTISSGGAGGAAGGGLDDLSSLFGTRSPNDFNPFAFLNNYVNNLQARGANIQLVFESPGGGGIGGGGGNLGDYFIGPGLEQLIQQLSENDPNRYGTPPASKNAVEGLPDINITEEMLSSDSSQCAVCKDSFELNEEAKQMPCKHIYHRDCILPWLELHNSCPVCRYELPTDDQDYENRKKDNSDGNNNSSSLGLGAAGGSQENRDDSNNQQTPRTLERRFRISLPSLFRGFSTSAETSSSGGDGGGNNSANNNATGSSNRGSGAGADQAREEDLD
ncbi:E3 ubiquitin-protein ligase RING1 [Salvia miltiorrhiza]|uniref:E3 ubiquitin-protein ligase RING1 n=1 Tax=Salvia miltiorrhiza TaxID=226208 RepID=UPI0025AC72B5|nr:E3 ubiquitin-protein ligase RING1 [Salvia miltiorrhiza]